MEKGAKSDERKEMMEMLAARNLTFTYPEDERPAICDVNLSVNEGDFLVICGYSGCGKSTLLRQFKPSLTPHGTRTGTVTYGGVDISRLSDRQCVKEIGFVTQSPESQIVTDKVWHELAFGAESLGYDTPLIRRLVAETASFFGIQNWFYANTSDLSGGQKQLLNLASVMVTRPKLLILDEPTGQLDPIAASEFLTTLQKLNLELGTTVILADHRLEEALPIANRAAVMEDGKLLFTGTPAELGKYLYESKSDMFYAMPAATRIAAALRPDMPYPVSPIEGREFLKNYIAGRGDLKLEETKIPATAREEQEPWEADLGREDSSREDLMRENFSPEAGGRKSVTVASSEKDGDFENRKAPLTARGVWFRYEKDSPDILKNFTLTAHEGELLCILGGNGTGKTTALSVLAGSFKPYRGEVNIGERTAVLPQNVQTLFVKKNVREELADILKQMGFKGEEAQGRMENVISICRLSGLEWRHPYDLSGGEQQRAALAKILLTKPRILLLDEPTKGMDVRFKREFAGIIKSLRSEGVCIVMVSHDVEFCAEYADRCCLFFDGNVVCEEPTRRFFTGNRYYTTAAAHIAEGILPDVVTTRDIINKVTDVKNEAEEPCGEAATIGQARIKVKTREENGEPRDKDGKDGRKQKRQAGEAKTREEDAKPLPLWRRIGALLSGGGALLVLFYAAKKGNLTEMTGPGGATGFGAGQLAIYGIFLLFLILTCVFIGRRSSSGAGKYVPSAGGEDKAREGALKGAADRGISRRTATSIILVVVAAGLTLFLGVRFIGREHYYLISLIMLAECMLPFFLRFEGRRPKARELVVIAVLCALTVAGRAAFFMLPQFKPVMAMTILAGVALGGESGFLVGSVSMLVSNILFSQGPWTPWQMFAMGLIGFLAGILYRIGLLARNRGTLAVFGAVCAIAIYGVIMNISSALIWSADSINADIIISYLLTGFPMDCVHAAATAFFLWVLSEPMLEKLGRIKVKYGLMS